MNELSREQVEEYTNRFHNCGFLHLKKVFDGHDAALRATITQQAQELERVKREFVNKDQIIASLAEQLAASQARCSDLEIRLSEMAERSGEREGEFIIVCEQRDILRARVKELEDERETQP